jgi:glycosyltransferase involved in cell wall biosynthesis
VFVLNIIYIVGFYPPPETANGIRNYYFVGELRRRGHNVTVIQVTPRVGGGIRIGDHGELVINYPTIGSGSLGRILTFLRNIYMLRPAVSSYAEKVKPSLVISAHPPVDAVYLGHWLSRSLGVPFVIDVHDLIELHVSGGLFRRFSRSIYYRGLGDIYAEADLLIAVTEAQKIALEKIAGAKNIEVIHNGVDVELYDKIYGAITHRKDKSYVEAVFLGDLSWRYHMVDKIIMGFGEARKILGSGRIRLKIIGEGPLKESLMKLAKSKGFGNDVIFTGYLERESMVKELILSDLALLGRPRQKDPWNITSTRTVIYEYAAAGLPILAFGPSPSHIEYFIKSNNLGVYLDTNDPKEIGEGIASMAQNLGMFDREKIRSVARKFDKKELSKIFANYVEKLL